MVISNFKKPIFIVGSGRSGTTFLGSCIGKIPEISYHVEPIVIKAAARYVYTNQWSNLKAKWFYRTLYAWLMRIHFDTDLRLAEKTPRNSFIIPFLYKIFPDAQFVHIIRDGRDVTVSLLEKPWYRADQVNSGQVEPGGYPHGPYARFWVEPDRIEEFETTSDTHRCIWLWRRYLETILQATSHLPKNQYYELRYEQLVFNTADETERLLDFLEISNSKSRKQFHKATANVKSDSVGRWKSELSENQLKEIYQDAGELLVRLNYYI
ncbi:sulfotransferase family protein [Crocosphaera chwakensis]|uniref:Sulfotransferase n=1 Tax=Crocosphaera chwakensis CCY0110 TaxID=391612 RepID=A3ISM1_9CHRO|nr:sulfotransferase [Crocosphaera chwakensis]EAZ90591.1 sulfotransferase [Crocosphaera chwakensis CCY0110]